MAEPIAFRILQNLQTALRAIATGSGYWYTVAALAVKLDPDQGVEALVGATALRPFIVLEPGRERWDYHPSMQVDLVMPVTVYYVNGPADQTNDDDLMKKWARGCADVEQAVAVETLFGVPALAQMPWIIRRSFSAVGGEVWSIVDLEIKQTRTFGKPNG